MLNRALLLVSHTRSSITHRSLAHAHLHSYTVALGGAPLALGALGALAAGRGALAGTAARRQKIQEEIAAREAAKRSLEADVDSGGLVAATVSSVCAAVDVVV